MINTIIIIQENEKRNPLSNILINDNDLLKLKSNETLADLLHNIDIINHFDIV